MKIFICSVRAQKRCCIYGNMTNAKQKKKDYAISNYLDILISTWCAKKIFSLGKNLEEIPETKTFPLTHEHGSSSLWLRVVSEDPMFPASTGCQHPGSGTKDRLPRCWPHARGNILHCIKVLVPGNVSIWVTCAHWHSYLPMNLFCVRICQSEILSYCVPILVKYTRVVQNNVGISNPGAFTV